MLVEQVKSLIQEAKKPQTPKNRLQVASLATALLASLEDAADVPAEVFQEVEPEGRVAAMIFVVSVLLNASMQ